MVEREQTHLERVVEDAGPVTFSVAKAMVEAVAGGYARMTWVDDRNAWGRLLMDALMRDARWSVATDDEWLDQVDELYGGMPAPLMERAQKLLLKGKQRVLWNDMQDLDEEGLMDLAESLAERSVDNARDALRDFYDRLVGQAEQIEELLSRVPTEVLVWDANTN